MKGNLERGFIVRRRRALRILLPFKNPSIPGPKSSKMSRVSVSLCLCHFFYELKDAFFKRKRLRKKKSGKVFVRRLHQLKKTSF